jgi:transitional endoplasmic reticulum ATPase
LSEVQLKVLDSRQTDVSRGIARIDQITLQKLGVSSGDVIEFSGKKKTSAIAWPAYSEDQDPNVMRIDGVLRKNADASINDYVVVRKAEVKNALSILLSQWIYN